MLLRGYKMKKYDVIIIGAGSVGTQTPIEFGYTVLFKLPLI